LVRHGGLRERRQISPLLRTLAPTPKSENRPARLPEEDKGDALTGLPVNERFENHKNGYKSAWVVKK
jgi:hypothetical protein